MSLASRRSENTHQVRGHREVNLRSGDMKSLGDCIQRREVNTGREGREEAGKRPDGDNRPFLVDREHRVITVIGTWVPIGVFMVCSRIVMLRGTRRRSRIGGLVAHGAGGMSSGKS